MTATWPQVASLGQTYISGRYYPPLGIYGTGVQSVTDNGNALFSPFVALVRQRFTGIACRVSVGGAGSVARMGIYANNGGQPGVQLTPDLGTVDTSTSGNKESVIDVTIGAGTSVWLAIVVQGAAQPNMYWAEGDALPQTGYPTPSAGYRYAWLAAGTNGALPTTAPSVVSSFDSPAVWLKAA